MSICPVKRVFKFLNHLATFAGFPVPPGIKWIDGKPDFRQIDEERWIEAAQKKLCGVCGKRLGEYAWYIGGEGCYQAKLFLDLPMHRPCAEASMELCPFLNGTKTTYRGELNRHPNQDATKRPEKLFLMRGLTVRLELGRIKGQEHLLLHAGQGLMKVRTF
jgi:hypothetical protein